MFARVSRITQRESPPIVLVHGLAVSSRYMIPLATWLAPRFRIYAPDLPGFGRSERPPRTPNIEELATALADWMRLCRLERAVVVGNSMGCQIVTELAIRWPELVRAVVMLGPTMDPSGGVWGQPARLMLDQFFEPLLLVALQAVDYLICGPLRTVQMFRFALRHNMPERVKRITQPVLVLRGERDTIASQAWVEHIARRTRGRLAVIPAAGHAINFNAAPQVADAVESFVEEIALTSK